MGLGKVCRRKLSRSIAAISNDGVSCRIVVAIDVELRREMSEILDAIKPLQEELNWLRSLQNDKEELFSRQRIIWLLMHEPKPSAGSEK